MQLIVDSHFGEAFLHKSCKGSGYGMGIVINAVFSLSSCSMKKNSCFHSPYVSF